MTWHSGAKRYPIPSSKFQPSPESSSIQPDGQFLNNFPSVCERKRAFCSVLLAMAWDQRRSERARSFWDFFSATKEHFSVARNFLRFLGIFIFILAVVRGWFFPSLWFSFYDFCVSVCLLLLVAAFCSFRLLMSKAQESCRPFSSSSELKLRSSQDGCTRVLQNQSKKKWF